MRWLFGFRDVGDESEGQGVGYGMVGLARSIGCVSDQQAR